MAEIVLIVVALLSRVGKLRELHIQGRVGWQAAGMGAAIAWQSTQIVHRVYSSITKKRRADLIARPDLMLLPSSEACGYCAAMKRLLTSVVRPLDLLERMK